jgi:hypothetical protein
MPTALPALQLNYGNLIFFSYFTSFQFVETNVQNYCKRQSYLRRQTVLARCPAFFSTGHCFDLRLAPTVENKNRRILKIFLKSESIRRIFKAINKLRFSGSL